MGNSGGILGWFARNPVAANLLMLLMVVGGIMSLMNIRQEVFPEIDTRTVTVSIPYPGASPEEVERGACQPVEEAIAGIEGIKRVRSTSSEGAGMVIVELEDDAPMRKVLNDVESAVDRITTFAERIEDPIISEATNQIQVLSIVVYGSVEQGTLKKAAERVRDALTALPGITVVKLGGLRQPEISIEVSEETLRRHGLSFTQVADAVRRGSDDLPGGTVRTRGGQLLLRTQGQRLHGEQFADLTVWTGADGSRLKLSDLAVIRDDFEETDVDFFFDGHPAAIINVYAVGKQDSLEVAHAAKKFVEDYRAHMPAGLQLATWFDRSTFLQGRIDLLTEDTIVGAILVFLCLALFLDLHVAFWVTVGIPTAFLGSFWLLPHLGVTINMISLFAFLIVLGIVVDDAIVIAENIHENRQKGMDPLEATVKGLRDVSVPVIVGVLTTVTAFLPLMFTTGAMGKILRQVPLVAVSVLLISLVEGLLVFPSHMVRQRRVGSPGPIARMQDRFDRLLRAFIQGPYQALIRRAVEFRYFTLAVAVSILILTAGLVAGGHVGFIFFEQLDADNVAADLAMPQGVPVEQTEAVVRRIEQAAERVRKKLDATMPPGSPSVFQHIGTTVGSQPFKSMVATGGPQLGHVAPGSDSHLAEINIELLPGQFRNIPAATIEKMLREETGQIAGASSIDFTSAFFSAGKDVHVELAHKDFPTLLRAVDALKGKVAQYRGVVEVEDSFELGKQEAKLTGLTPVGEAMGLRLLDVGRQVRAGFYGEEVQRIQRGRDEVKVMVRYPREERGSIEDLHAMRLRLPDGVEAPLGSVAHWEVGRAYSTISRTDRRRVVSVTAGVDPSLNQANTVNADITTNVLPALKAEFPGLEFNFEGQQKEQADSMASLGRNFTIALLAIFVLLGVQFRSYVQPLIVMSAIPFGLLGAVFGHIVMGLKLSFMSMFGMVALTGVVINDALILIDTLNRFREEGMELREAVVQAGIRRFRAILLNMGTTFLGLGPMVWEKSLQARFLVPMAMSLAFGVLISTTVTLILVPTLCMIVEDGRAWFQRVRRRFKPQPALIRD